MRLYRTNRCWYAGDLPPRIASACRMRMNAVLVGVCVLSGRTSGSVSQQYANVVRRIAVAPRPNRKNLRSTLFAGSEDPASCGHHPPTTILMRVPGLGAVAGSLPFMIASELAFVAPPDCFASESQVSPDRAV